VKNKFSPPLFHGKSIKRERRNERVTSSYSLLREFPPILLRVVREEEDRERSLSFCFPRFLFFLLLRRKNSGGDRVSYPFFLRFFSSLSSAEVKCEGRSSDFFPSFLPKVKAKKQKAIRTPLFFFKKEETTVPLSPPPLFPPP